MYTLMTVLAIIVILIGTNYRYYKETVKEVDGKTIRTVVRYGKKPKSDD